MTKDVLITVLKQRVKMEIASLPSHASLDPEGYDTGYNDGFSDGLTTLLDILEEYDKV